MIVERCDRCAGELVDAKCELCITVRVLRDLDAACMAFTPLRHRFKMQLAAARRVLAKYDSKYPPVETHA